METKRCGIVGCRGFGKYPVGLGILLCEGHFTQLRDGLRVYEGMESKEFFVVYGILVVITVVLCILL